MASTSWSISILCDSCTSLPAPWVGRPFHEDHDTGQRDRDRAIMILSHAHSLRCEAQRLFDAAKAVQLKQGNLEEQSQRRFWRLWWLLGELTKVERDTSRGAAVLALLEIGAPAQIPEARKSLRVLPGKTVGRIWDGSIAIFLVLIKLRTQAEGVSGVIGIQPLLNLQLRDELSQEVPVAHQNSRSSPPRPPHHFLPPSHHNGNNKYPPASPARYLSPSYPPP